MTSARITALVERITTRDAKRTEADLQSLIRELLSSGELDLGGSDVIKLEVPVGDGTRRRLDIELGNCCIEVKKDLRRHGALSDAREQLAGYVRTRAGEMGQRYVGIITDGTSWNLYRLGEANALALVDDFSAARDTPGALMTWLESVLATDQGIPATPKHIRERLGAESPAHKLDHETLKDLFDRHGHIPEVQVKKDLWAKLLRTAFGASFTDSSALFVDHTLLVLTAEAIAHAVIGWDLRAGHLTARDIATGAKFHEAQIYGVVEEDFFDWVLSVEGGPEFVTDLARRVGRFDWSTSTGHDVLKALYTSVLPTEAREALGEYYTPDWLAYRMVKDVYTDPLHQRLLEPSCGSGTFLLHAVRAHLEAAEEAGMSTGEAVVSVINHVVGMDIHPVSVILARVTYLMAIGGSRLNDGTRQPIAIPVYLGDSLQWEQRRDLLAGQSEITITTEGDDLVEGGGALFGDDLHFPVSVLADANNFDRLVAAMANLAITETRSPRAAMRKTLKDAGIHDEEEQRLLTATFDTMRRLHLSGRNHIWGYYVRNLIRPLWLSDPLNRVDVMVGNPPWLRYSKMGKAMQERYRSLAKDRQLLTGGLGASARDLSTLFVARCVELYLKDEGAFAFVMPHGVLSRKPHAGFRTANWSSKAAVIRVAFETPWDLADVDTGFPMTSCVIRGSRADAAGPMPGQTVSWKGRLSNPDQTWEAIAHRVTESPGTIAAIDSGPVSPYARAFRQGAILVPRFLLFVTEPSHTNPLGVGAGREQVESRRSRQEKSPWKSMDSLTGIVESRYVRDVHLGETVAPFRLLDPLRAVLPLTPTGILAPDRIEESSGLSNWWQQVEEAWEKGRKPSEGKPLIERFDYHAQLSAQLPTSPNRVVYSKSGGSLVAARVSDTDAIIDHKLYWAPTASRSEANYLVAVLNAPVTARAVTAFQSRGLFGPRDFDKYVWHLPIPVFDPSKSLHLLLAALGERAEIEASSVEVNPAATFQDARKRVLEALVSSGVAAELDALVSTLLGLDSERDNVPSADLDIKARALADGKPFVRLTETGPLLSDVDVALDIDCEFDAEGIALWGVLRTHGGQSEYLSFGGPNCEHDAPTKDFVTWLLQQVADADARGDSIGIYHYGATEPARVRRFLGERESTLLTARMTDLLALVRDHFYAPRGYGLKTLTEPMGASWPIDGTTGHQARDWIARSRSGDAQAWEDLVAYNEADTSALEVLRTQITATDPPSPKGGS